MSGPCNPRRPPRCPLGRAPARGGASGRWLARRAGLGAAALLLMLAPAVSQTHRGPTSVAPLAEKLIDAVVNISTSQTVKGPEGAPLPKVPKGAPFEEFFEDFFNRKGGKSPSDRKVSSLGSGFVIDGKEGHVVTNNHVIDGADEIIINFNDGTKLKVEKVLGKDAKTDLALLKVTPKKPLPAVPFGSSDKLKVGDWVMAIGTRSAWRLGDGRHSLGQAARHQLGPYILKVSDIVAENVKKRAELTRTYNDAIASADGIMRAAQRTRPTITVRPGRHRTRLPDTIRNIQQTYQEDALDAVRNLDAIGLLRAKEKRDKDLANAVQTATGPMPPSKRTISARWQSCRCA